MPYTFSTTTTDADPGAGNIRYNNATIASVTQIFIDNLDQLGNTQTGWYGTWDDSTNTTSEGYLYITSASSAETTVNIFNVTGAVTSAVGYHKIPVAHVSGTLPANSTLVSINFSRSGDLGAQGVQGTTGSLSTYSATIGNGSATSFTVTHNLNVTNDSFVSVREVSSGYYVYPDVKYVNANSVLVEFVSAPTTNQYRVTVAGA
jgi:hypothetical protein